jgi:hypothetical protein
VQRLTQRVTPAAPRRAHNGQWPSCAGHTSGRRRPRRAAPGAPLSGRPLCSRSAVGHGSGPRRSHSFEARQPASQLTGSAASRSPAALRGRAWPGRVGVALGLVGRAGPAHRQPKASALLAHCVSFGCSSGAGASGAAAGRAPRRGAQQQHPQGAAAAQDKTSAPVISPHPF